MEAGARRVLLVALVGSLLLAGCAKPPTPTVTRILAQGDMVVVSLPKGSLRGADDADQAWSGVFSGPEGKARLRERSNEAVVTCGWGYVKDDWAWSLEAGEARPPLPSGETVLGCVVDGGSTLAGLEEPGKSLLTCSDLVVVPLLVLKLGREPFPSEVEQERVDCLVEAVLGS